jgi:uncharacterized protein (TIGR02588 family)
MSEAAQAGEQKRARGQAAVRRGRSLAEWVSFGVAAAILALVAGLVIYDWLTTPRQEPRVSVRQEGAIRSADGLFYVPFTVENSAGNTVEALRVHAELEVDGSVVESGEQEFDFLSGGEQGQGAFVFTRDPEQGELRLRITGYRLP